MHIDYDKLETLTVKILREIAKQLQLGSISTLKKDALISRIRTTRPATVVELEFKEEPRVVSPIAPILIQAQEENSQMLTEDAIHAMNLTKLKEFAKTLGISGIQKYRIGTMNELRKKVLDAQRATINTPDPVVVRIVEPELLVPIVVEDIPSIDLRMDQLLLEISQLPSEEQWLRLAPCAQMIEELRKVLFPIEEKKERSPSPPRGRSPTIARRRSTSPLTPTIHIAPVVIEVIEEKEDDIDVLPDFIQAPDVSLDELEDIVAGMHETLPDTIEHELLEIERNIEKCLLMV